MSELTLFDPSANDQIRELLVQQHGRLAQSHLPVKARSSLARNYDVSISQFGEWMATTTHIMPTRSALEDWRDQMIQDGKAVRTVNARLAALRKLLRAVAADVTRIDVRLALESWADVKDAKATKVQDKTETDYGRRLKVKEVERLINSIPRSNIKGLRDRAMIAVMVGCGLRVSELVALTIKDFFLTSNDVGQRGVQVLHGKGDKKRVVVFGASSAWVVKAVATYTSALGLTPMLNGDQILFRQVQRVKKGYASTENPLSIRTAQRAVEVYGYNAHDLRRTYAKLCRDAGMEWDSIRLNMGHSSVQTTERYVGTEVDWSKREPKWKITLED
jgi:site-specific recombinase XerD